MSRIHFFVATLIAAVIVACACSPAKRPAEEMDSGTDTDTGSDDGLPWDPDAGDALVHKPVNVFIEPTDHNSGFMAMAFDGNNIAISRSDIEFTHNPSLPNEYNTLFLIFPWESPEDVMIGSFAQEPPACPSGYVWHNANSKPHPHPDGFLLITSAIGNNDTGCELVQTLWDTGANLLDGPHTFSGLFPDKVFQAMDPNGAVDQDGIVTTGHLKGVGFEEDGDTDSEGEVVFDVDRFGSGGFHERLTHESFPWPDTQGGDDQVISSGSGQNVYLHDGVLTVLGMGYDGIANTYIVLARADTDGTVTQGASRVLEMPPKPADLILCEQTYALFTFAAHSDGIMVLAKVHYMDPELVDYDPTIDEPFIIGLWTRLISFDGTPLGEWTQLVEYQSHVSSNRARMAWSGQYFGVCYNDPLDTHKFIVLDENGVQAMEPIDLFWPIPPVENLILPCDLVAVDEDTFVIALGVHSDPPQEYASGTWVTHVDVTIVE